MPEATRRARYHHGALRTALIDTSIDLLTERGLDGFSMAEVSRRLGVAQAAPYRHFTDRDELLAAVAGYAGELLHERITRVTEDGTPAQRLAAAAAEYVRFAAEQRPLFQALFGSGLDKRGPDLQRTGQTIGELFLGPARQLCETEPHAQRLTSAIVATAHGNAALMIDHGIDDAAPEDTAAAVRALIAGRRWLT
jgi:AcrR family transcriptional regulator